MRRFRRSIGGCVFAIGLATLACDASQPVPGQTAEPPAPGLSVEDPPPVALSGCDSIPGVSVVFPLCNGLVPYPEVTVRGALDGIDVAAVRVGGVAAAVDGDQWRAPVTLAPGHNTIAVEIETTSGAIVAAAELSVIHYDELMRSPRWLVVDEKRGQTLVSDYARPAVVAIDLATGHPTTLSYDPFGSGTDLFGLRDIALDAARDRLLVIDRGDSDLGAIDLDTGAFSMLSPNTADYGPVTGFVTDLTVAGDRAYLYDSAADVVYAVDLETGAREVACADSPGRDLTPSGAADRLLVGRRLPFSDTVGVLDLATCAVSAGPGGHLASQLYAIARDPASSRIAALELNEWYQAIAAIDPQTDEVVRSGNLSEYPRDVVLPSAVFTELAWWQGRVLMTAPGSGAVLSLDPERGTLAPLSGPFVGGGANYSDAVALAVDAARDRVLVLSRYEGLVAVSMRSGARERYVELPDGAGQDGGAWRFASDMVLADDQMFYVDRDGLVVAFSLATGERAVLPVDGAPFYAPALAWDEDEQRLFVATPELLVGYDVAAQTSAQVPIAVPGVPNAIAWDPVRRRVLLAASQSSALHAIDPDSGALVQASALGVGGGASRPVALAIDPAHGRVVVDVVSFGEVRVEAVDLQSGVHSRLSTHARGRGPRRCNSRSIDLTARGEVAVIDCGWFVMAADLDTGDRMYLSR